MGASFLSGLLGGIGDTVQKKQAQDLALKVQDLAAKREAWMAVMRAQDASPQAKMAALESMILSSSQQQGGGKKGGGKKQGGDQQGGLSSILGPLIGSMGPGGNGQQKDPGIFIDPAQRAEQQEQLNVKQAGEEEAARAAAKSKQDKIDRQQEYEDLVGKGVSPREAEERAWGIAPLVETNPPVEGTVNGQVSTARWDRAKQQWINPDTQQPVAGFVPGKPTKPNETEQAVSDYLASKKLQDTSENRTKAREHIKAFGPTLSFNLQSGAGGGVAPLKPGETPVTGEAVLKGVSAGDIGIIKGLAEGRISLPSSFALRTPYWQRIMGLLERYDPDFSEQRAQIRKAFTTGPDGKNIGALNTASVHLDTMAQAAKALGTGNFRPGNEAYVRFKTMFGSSAPTSFQAVRDAVSGEMAAALKGNATDVEIQNIRSGIEAQSSPEQLAGYIDMQLHILHQKLDTYQQRYEQQIPGDTVWSPILPQAKAVFEKHGVGKGVEGPKVGDVEDGYKFLGGNPADPKSWKKAGQ